MSRQTSWSLLIGGMVAVVVALVAVMTLTGGAEPEPAATADDTSGDSSLIRPDSRVMGEEGATGVTFVEFLDFECEACRAAYPLVEQLREDYAGEVTFVARYFPLPGHFNSERAARAVESAARQGFFEPMYQKMYETQAEWGEGREPLDDLFRSFAVEIGLSMEQYDADYASAEVAERVQRDVDDGRALGVSGTPTFYVDGELVRPESGQDLVDAIDRALEAR